MTQRPSRSPATSPTPTPTPSPEETGVALVRCDNPEGFTIGYPKDWHTNSGEVVPRCSQFNPEPFEVPRGTDERVAAITAYIDSVSFEDVSAPRDRRDATAREELTIDGRPAVKLEWRVGSRNIWPEGTPITAYMIEAPPSEDGRDRTLFVDTVGIGSFDYERNQEVLDVIAPGITWSTGSA